MLILLGLFPGRGRRAASRARTRPGRHRRQVMFGAVAASASTSWPAFQLDRRALIIAGVAGPWGWACRKCRNPVACRMRKGVLESGVATGRVCAPVMNWFLPEEVGRA